MRGALLKLLANHPELKRVDTDLKHQVVSWFNRGFLELRVIDWNSPAAVLERIIQYESVHAIQGWDDLRSRLRENRMCFAFFHPAMPDDPLVFVEVALTSGIPTAIAPLIDKTAEPADEKDLDTVVFYSISNCHPGLAGVSFGNFLIKQVVEEVGKRYPKAKRYVTLSPVPGFCKSPHPRVHRISTSTSCAHWPKFTVPTPPTHAGKPRLHSARGILSKNAPSI